MNVKSFCRCS